MVYRKNRELVDEEVEDFRLLYDNDKGENHFLNETAGLIWELLPDQFEDLSEFREEFISRFCAEVEREVLENDFDECIDRFVAGGLIYVRDGR